MNAENVVMMDNLPSVATQYTQYIDDLVNTYRGRAREGSGARPVPVPVKETGTGDTTTPSMSATEAQSTFKQMVADGKIPHGRFVDSVSGQNYPLSAKQLAVVLDIIAKARAKEASH